MADETIKRVVKMPQGGTVTVTVTSTEPIREEDFLILRPQAAIEMAHCLMDLGNALAPSEKPESK